MAHLYRSLDTTVSQYKDRSFPGTAEEYQRLLRESRTLYVGNLSFHTTEEQVWEVFRSAGEVRRIIMGLDAKNLTACGFCFVEYYTREDATRAVQWVTGLKVDERPVRVDWDPGFTEGRQFGRGRNGGQIRDEWRENYDPGRGGYGSLYMQRSSDEAAPRRRLRDAEGGDALQELEQASRKRERGDDGGDGGGGNEEERSVRAREGQEGDE